MSNRAPQIKVRRGNEHYGRNLTLFLWIDGAVLGEVPPGAERTFELEGPGAFEARFVIDGCRSAPCAFTIGQGERLTLRAVLPEAPVLAAIFNRNSFGVFVTERQLPEKI